ncbi:MAG: lysylphosphatidylglycerol synthase transmembrane domain-containing protein [Vicinamibacterales bacterium]
MNAYPRRHSRYTSAILSALVGGGFVWWFLAGVSLPTVAAEIRLSRLPYLTAAVLLSLSGFAFRTWRWQQLLGPLKWIPARRVASAIFIGWAASAVLPGRVGEVARAWILGREGIRRSAAFGTIVLERLLDILAVLLLFAASVAVLPAASTAQSPLMVAIRTGALLTFCALMLVGLLLLAAHHVPGALLRRLKEWAGRLPYGVGHRALGMIEAFGRGLSAALTDSPSAGAGSASPRTVVALHTAVLWMIICGVHALLFRAFALEVSALRIPIMLLLITMGLAVPVPAALGSYHKAVQIGLAVLFGVPQNTAAAYAIVSHLITQVLPAVIGATLLAREGLALSSLAGGSAASRSLDE